MRQVAFWIIFSLFLASCGAYDAATEMYEHSKAVEAEMSEEFGVDTFVGFRWENGALQDVTVAFIGVPSNLPVTAIVERAKNSIAAHFPDEPKQVTVSITVSTK